MVKSRIKSWLMDHPEVLSAVVTGTIILAEVSDKVPDIEGKSGAGSTLGP